MRLIDESELEKSIEKWLNPNPNADRMVDIKDIVVSVMMEIEEQPTAYDVDKVVAKLKKNPNHRAVCIRQDVRISETQLSFANIVQC